VEEQDGVRVGTVDCTASVTVLEVNVRGTDAGGSRSKMKERARPSLGGSSVMTLLFAPHSSRGRSEWVLM